MKRPSELSQQDIQEAKAAFTVRYRQKLLADGQRVRAEALFDAKPGQFLVAGVVCGSCLTFNEATIAGVRFCRKCGLPISTAIKKKKP